MNLQQGDIVLFSGKTSLHLRIQEWIHSKWSQVSLVIVWGGKFALFESTKLPISKDVIKKQLVTGVQVVSLSEKLSLFEGDVAFRQLQPSLDLERGKKLYAFVNSAIGKPYNDSKYVMVRGMHRKNTKGDDSTYFCSQLVAEALQRCNILQNTTKELASTNYSPADFSSVNSLSLVEGFSYSNEIYLKQNR